MRTDIDLSPFRRSMVGFDRLFDLLESAPRAEGGDGFPPFDLVKDGEDRYRINLAVAGFAPEQIEVAAHQNQLTISGQPAKTEARGEYLHRGIAGRGFVRSFPLADYIEVESAELRDGVLSIALKRVVPDEMKPRKIEIHSRASSPPGIAQAGSDQREAA
jgi:molecular chaperone IbpA